MSRLHDRRIAPLPLKGKGWRFRKLRDERGEFGHVRSRYLRHPLLKPISEMLATLIAKHSSERFPEHDNSGELRMECG